MAFGKGTWVFQNKKLPGTYINFIGEKPTKGVMGTRGKAAFAMAFDWGEDSDEIFVLTPSEFRSNSKKLFGYGYLDPKLSAIKDIFLGGARELYLYRLNGSGGTAASSTELNAVARYKGVRGNSIVVTIAANGKKFDVITSIDGMTVDNQIAIEAGELKDNDFVIFNTPSTTTLTPKTYTFTKGANGPDGGEAKHVDFLNKLEAYEVNCVGAVDPTVTALYEKWVIDQRKLYSNTIQAVLFNAPANNEAVINVGDSADLVPWFLGAESGCELNATVQNKVYDGSAVPTKNYTQGELEKALDAGQLVLQRIGNEYRVLEDINSLLTFDETKNEDFRYNQTIRVMDQISLDVSKIFNEGYIGKVANNEAGRLSFRNQVAILLTTYVNAGVLDPYDGTDLVCVAGVQKGALEVTMSIKLVDMLEKAYITIVVG